MKVILCGGGTAGHVTPALAMGKALKKHFPGTELVYVGRSNGKENLAVLKSGIKLEQIDIYGLKRKISLKNLLLPLNIIGAVSRCKQIIKEFTPDAVICTGGYVSYPMLCAARAMRVPSFIHESNVYPGLVTRLSCNKVTRVLLSHGETAEYLSKRAPTELIGTPTLHTARGMTRERARRTLGIPNDVFYIISFGGSLGARYLNEIVIEMKEKENEYKDLYHLHGCGKNEADKLKAAYPELFDQKGGLVFTEYIDNVPLHLSACDLAVTRSGALTLAEITEAQIPAVLIPSENVAADHQYKNALKYKAGGAAIVIRESETTAKEAAKIITELMKNRQALKQMKNAARAIKGANSEELFIKAYSDALAGISAKH